MMEFAQAKHQQGHQIFQVAFDTIFVSNHEVTHGIVLFSNEKVNNNCGKLKYKLEYSQTQSAKDFYNHLETVASDLTETGNKIHCISIDSLSSYFGLTLAETTYCLMVYSKDVDNFQHETGLRIIKADDNSSYDQFIESLKMILFESIYCT